MTTSEIKLGRLSECTFEQALELWNRGFEGYFVDMTTTMERLMQHMSIHGIRPDWSVVAFADGRPVGFVLLAVKTVDGVKLVWNGGTGVFSEYRGRGIAKKMMLEARRIMREQQADRGMLEVFTDNVQAISVYQQAGFHIVDRVAGLTKKDSFAEPFYSGRRPNDLQLAWGRPADVKRLPFYREHAAWYCQWHHIRDGESLIIRSKDGNQALAYALCKRQVDDDGRLAAVLLFQCEVGPLGRNRREQLFRIMLEEMYQPLSISCVRKTVNLTTAHPELNDLFKEAGFTADYEQYVMILESMTNCNRQGALQQ